MRRKGLQVRRMIEREKHVDFNVKTKNLLSYVFCFFKKATIFVAKEGMKSIAGRKWWPALNFKLVQNPVGKSDINGTEKEVEQLSAETKTIAKEFLKLFSRKGKKDYKSKRK